MNFERFSGFLSRELGGDLNTTANINDKKVIRLYLLGGLTDEKLAGAIDEAMLADDVYAEKIELLEEDLIEEFLEASLSDAERKSFSKRLRNSSELRERVSLISRIKPFAASEPVMEGVEKNIAITGWFLNRLTVLRFAVLLVGVTLIGIAVWRFALVESDVNVAFLDLQRSVSGQRLTAGRSTLEPTYAPVISTRGAAPEADLTSPEFRNARAILLSAEIKDPQDPEILHLLGLMHLAEQDVDKAIAEMEKAERLAPTNAGLLSDLGAVYLERSMRTKIAGSGGERIRDQALALEFTDKALVVDPVRLDTLFNRALILQEMGLSFQAKKAWEEYLAKDSNSAWAVEAKKRLEALDQPTSMFRTPETIVTDFWAAYDAGERERAWRIVSESKELITGSTVFFQVAGLFVRAAASGSELEAARNLNGLKFIAEIESERSPDLYFAGLYRYYRLVSASDLAKIMVANENSAKGYGAVLTGNWKAAFDLFEKAKGLYSEAGNTWEAELAEFQLCYILTQQRQIEQSADRLRVLAMQSSKERHVWISSLVDGWIASNYSLSGEYATSVGFGKRSLTSAKEIGDTYNVQKAAGQLTNQYFKLGNEARVLEMVAVNTVSPPVYFQSPRQLSRNLLFASQGFLRFGYLAAARANVREQLIISRDILKDMWLTHSAYLNSARVNSTRGDSEAAISDADESLKLARSFPDEAMQRRLELQSNLLIADVERGAENYENALKSYDQVIRDYDSDEFVTSLYQARRGRLICLSELKRNSEFTAEMAAVIALFEQNRRAIEDETDRNIFFESEQSVYDIATEYAYSKLNDAELAFEYAEGSRANSLLGAIPGNDRPKPGLAGLQSSIPDDTCVLYFAVLPRQTLVWTISKEDWNVRSIAVLSSSLTDRIKVFSDSIARKRVAKDEAKALYNELVEPNAEGFRQKDLLCIIPDKSLLSLSFAALISTQSDRYLIEDIALMYSPSLRVFDKLSHIARSKGSGLEDERFVGIGAAVFKKGENVGLADIDEVKVEVDEISRIYKKSVVYTGDKVTKKAFKNSFKNGSVFHFAGHYVSNRNVPSESRFLVSDGSVSVGDLLGTIHFAPKLVILSACESGIERYYAGEGMIGASRAFLGAGVPLVIGSRWAVDSEATRELMTAFHKQVKANAPQALRAAQIQILTSQGKYADPYYWAGFMPIGG